MKFHIFARSNWYLMMKEMKAFEVPFIGLKEGEHKFEYQIDNKFFDAFQYDEFDETNINVVLVFVKKPTMLELKFSSEGTVNVPCDVTGESFDMETKGDLSMIVKFGEGFDDGNEEVAYISNSAHRINVAHYIFEMLVLSFPAKRVHPKVLDGTLESDAFQKLEELKIRKSTTNIEEATDPRWGKLKDLLIDKTQRNGTSKEKNI
tara:strand:- start:79329 stop:79943 length:615 start_codon:yes stop_codon:yes gene_type:complete